MSGQAELTLAASQVRAGAQVMARAFFEDPFFTFSLPDPARRRRVLPWLFERTIRYGQRYGRVLTTPGLEGLAVWLGPRHPSVGLAGSLQTGLFLLPWKLGVRALLRSLRLSNLADQLHRQSVTGAHWYLLGLGVEPSLQGRGVGRALLQPLLAQADREKAFCYLDTNNQDNLRFYERFGFAVVCQGHAIPGGPHTWGMRRQASDGL